jgi:hypothetical protein
MVVAYAVQTLTDTFLTEALPFVARRKDFDGTFLVFDVPLDITTRTVFSVDLHRCNCDCFIPKKVCGTMLF